MHWTEMDDMGRPVPQRVLTVWTNEIDNGPRSSRQAVRYPTGRSATVADGFLTVLDEDKDAIGGFAAGTWYSWGFIEPRNTVYWPDNTNWPAEQDVHFGNTKGSYERTTP